MADDLDVEAAGPDFRVALCVVFAVASVVGIPIARKKVRGGTVVGWIGYELRLRECRVGVSPGRAAWAVKWCKGLREAGIANTAPVEEGVGRLSFIAWMLEYEKPFLSSIQRFLAVEERDVVRSLPVYVLLSLRLSHPTSSHRLRFQPSSLRSIAMAGGPIDTRRLSMGRWRIASCHLRARGLCSLDGFEVLAAAAHERGSWEASCGGTGDERRG